MGDAAPQSVQCPHMSLISPHAHLCCWTVSGLTCPSGRCDSSWEFGICAALAVAKVCSSLPKVLLPPFHPRLAAPNREHHTRASPQLYFTSRAAAHGKENADLRKIPGALSLRPIFPRLFLILEAGGAAGMDHTGPVPVFISMEAAHRLARSLLPTPPGLGRAGGNPAAPGVQGLIIHILISTHVVMGVINGCGSIQAGWGCAASLPSHTLGWGTSLWDAELRHARS